MHDQIQCPECGMKLRKGSTFCIGCGNKIPDNPQPLSADDSQNDVEDILPAVEESGLDEIPIAEAAPIPDIAESEDEVLEASDELSWEDTQPEALAEEDHIEKIEPLESDADEISVSSDKEGESEPEKPTSGDLSWEEGIQEIKEGMPFKEIEPPRAFAEADSIVVSTDDALQHLFPEVKDDATRDAVAHLFPEGRGSTSTSFIDVVVGKPERISVSRPKEVDTPVCPNCGVIHTSDDFEYPPYVFDAMGKARIEHGDSLLAENEHETAIQNFEIAKMLFERSGNEKNLAEAVKRVDFGYDEMAKFHFDQAETHLKEGGYEWAVVQFKKARELYMFTTDTKKRARCAERAREAYVDWGKALENEADQLAKAGKTRDALGKYQEAAAKYREGGDTKRLRGLDKKIRKA